MPWSVLDLSRITDDLIGLLTDAVTAAAPGFQIDISGAMPEVSRGGEIPDTVLNLYLLHVSQDPYYRSTSMVSTKPQANKSHPLSLDLHYLLTAYAKDKYNHEQLAMGIALRCFHENAIVRKPPDHEEYTITMAVETADEMSRLWQALSAPLRLAVVYRVSIVFVTPSAQPVPPLGPPPTALALSVSPMSGAGLSPARLFGATAQLVGATARTSFFVASDKSGMDTMPSVSVPGLVCAGDTLVVTGTGLDDPDYSHVYLDAADVTAKRSAGATPNDFLLVIDKTRPPAVYDLTVGGSGPTPRSGKIAITVAARVDVLSGPPELGHDGGGIYTLTGAGFTPGSTALFFGAAPLTKVAGPLLGDGQFAVDGAGTTITFKAPSPPPPGRNYIGVRVNGIDSPPSWYVTVP